MVRILVFLLIWVGFFFFAVVTRNYFDYATFDLTVAEIGGFIACLWLAKTQEERLW